MDFDELDSIIHLNKKGKLDKIAYCRNFSYRHADSAMMNDILRQIAINLNYLVAKFDTMHFEDIILEIRKNCIKKFHIGLHSQTNPSTTYAINYIEKNKRQEAKAKLMYISNQIWLYLTARGSVDHLRS